MQNRESYITEDNCRYHYASDDPGYMEGYRSADIRPADVLSDVHDPDICVLSYRKSRMGRIYVLYSADGGDLLSGSLYA